MNEELQDNPYKVKYLTLLREFKKYDKKRKAYYAEKMEELGKLQSIIQEIEDCSGKLDIIANFLNIRSENKKLRAELKQIHSDYQKQLDVVRKLLDPETIHLYRNLSKKDIELTNRICKLEGTIVNYKIKLQKAENLANEYLKNLIKLQNNGSTTA